MKVELEFEPYPKNVGYEFLVRIATLLKDGKKLNELTKFMYSLSEEELYTDFSENVDELDVKIAIINNPNATKETLLMFLNDEDESVRAALAGAENLPDGFMNVLSTDSNNYVLKCLYDNPKCSEKVYNQIVQKMCDMYSGKKISRVDVNLFIKKLIESKYATQVQKDKLCTLIEEKPVKHLGFKFLKGIKA